MKISTNWLREYVEHDLPPEALAEALTMAGLEVDGIDRVGASLDGVVVGRVLAVEPHPNADRLVLCQVDLGNEAPVQIACGAPNVAAGQKAPIATVGTTLLLPDEDDPEQRTPVEIKEVTLRGEPSAGMICAEDELGLSDDHAGIMVLDDEAPVGQPLADYLEAQGVAPQDTVLDIEITPNRPDATNHIGVARDVAALTDTRLLRPEGSLPNEGGATAEQVAVNIHAPEACPRYAAMLVRNVTVGESPTWLRRRLEAIGLCPRNNIVDITNFVMHECGQPLHAFDLDQLTGNAINVRLTDGEERFTTLDGQERTLPDGALLICDAERPVALAGIMGGQNSEVSERTTNVLIESAYFDPSTTRRTAKALQLQTDSSYRFERGVDRDGQVWAAARAAQLMADLAGSRVVPGLVDEQARPVETRTVALRPARIDQLLGVHVPEEEVVDLLEAIGFETHAEDPLDVIAEHAMEGRSLELDHEECVLHCTVPTFRPDVEREVDVIEEVARLHGYDQIPEPAHLAVPSRPPREEPGDALRQQARSLLSGLGYREIYTNSLLRKERAERFNVPALSGQEEKHPIVETLNPTSQEMAAMRPRLLPGLLAVMRHNQHHGQRVLRFMEFGHVYHRADQPATLIPGFAEHESLILGLSGPHAPTGWDTEPRPADFFDLKGTVAALLDALALPDITLEPASADTPVTAYHLTICSKDVPLGVVARLADEVAADFDLEASTFFAELHWQRLVQRIKPEAHRRYAPVSRFPVVERDLAVVVDAEQPAGPLLETIRQAGAPLLQRATLFDLYEGEHLDAGHKSLAFRLRFGADRTLRDEEVDDRIAAILDQLNTEHGAALRR